MDQSQMGLRAELEARLQFETLVADLSARFINVPAEQVDDEINDALRLLCEYLDTDTATVWQEAEGDSGNYLLTHIRRPLGGPPIPEPMDAKTYFPWAAEKLSRGEIVFLPKLADLPPEAVRELESRLHFGVKSSVVFPLSTGGGPVFGVISFDSMRKEIAWPDELLQRLQVVARMLANALARKRSELALRQSEARLTLAAESAGAGLWSLDPASGLLWASDRARQMFAVAPNRPFTMVALRQVIHPEDRGRVEQAIQQALATGQTTGVEYRVVLPDKTMRWFSARGRRQPGPTGEGERLMGVTLDITERKQTEEALLRSLAEVRGFKDRLQAESDYLKTEIKVTQPQGDILGQSQAIKKVLHQVEQVAPTDSTVLINGETGSGKELVAQAIHRLSPRKDRLMVMVNCAALPGALVESELFGREKGAFTGALMRQAGRFELADRSTIFLDEIGELSPEVQVKLLRVLESGEFERLGSSKTLQVNVRLVAATNRDLAQDVRRGRFREDLYYRLNVFPIRVPSLRERAEDIPVLAWAFVSEFAMRMGKTITKVPRKAMDALQTYSWPGNVRELRNVIERAVIVTTGDTLKLTPPGDSAQTIPMPMTLADNEREHILSILEGTGWRIKGPRGAARKLGINPSTLYTRMEKLGIPTRRAQDRAY